MEMQFHDFVEMLFGSKVKVKVLRTLWKHMFFTVLYVQARVFSELVK
jgi:hypothetical protein